MLKEFLQKYSEEPSTGEASKVWTYAEYETPHGIREELVFVDKSSIIQLMPSGELSLLLINCKDKKIITHIAYLILDLFNREYPAGMPLTLYGSGYQAIVLLKEIAGLHIEEVYAKGTIERVDRFNNSSEKEISKLVGVLIRRAPL